MDHGERTIAGVLDCIYQGGGHFALQLHPALAPEMDHLGHIRQVITRELDDEHPLQPVHPGRGPIDQGLAFLDLGRQREPTVRLMSPFAQLPHDFQFLESIRVFKPVNLKACLCRRQSHGHLNAGP